MDDIEEGTVLCHAETSAFTWDVALQGESVVGCQSIGLVSKDRSWLDIKFLHIHTCPRQQKKTNKSVKANRITNKPISLLEGRNAELTRQHCSHRIGRNDGETFTMNPPHWRQ